MKLFFRYENKSYYSLINLVDLRQFNWDYKTEKTQYNSFSFKSTSLMNNVWYKMSILGKDSNNISTFQAIFSVKIHIWSYNDESNSKQYPPLYMRMFLGGNYLWRSRMSVRHSFIKMVISTKHKTDRMNSLSRMSFDGSLSSFLLIHCGSWVLFRWQLTQMNIFSGFVFRC